MTLSVAGTGAMVRLVAVGEIDSSTAPVLRDQLAMLLDSAVQDITVDLDAVTFLDSAGLCVLAAAHRRAIGQGAALRVVASGRAVIRPLQITGLWALLAEAPDAPATATAL